MKSRLKKKLIAPAVVLAVLFAGAAPAAALDTDPPFEAQVENMTFGENALPKPADVSGNMFWSPALCVQSPLNATTYPVAAMAQQYNIRVGAPLAINFRADCTSAGYPPSRSFTISTYSSTADTCHTVLNSERALYNGMWRWTNHPVVFINTHGGNCVQTQTRRNHAISEAIGLLLGLKQLNSAGWNSRVMNNTLYSWDHIPTVSQMEGDRVWSIITGAYGGL